MKNFVPAYLVLSSAVADRVRRLRVPDDRGALFYRYGVPLLLVAMLAIAFTDVEDNLATQMAGLYDSVKSSLSSDDTSTFSSDPPAFGG